MAFPPGLMGPVPMIHSETDPAQMEGVVAQLEVARRYTIKLSEIIQEQARDLDAQAAELEAAATQAQQDKQLIAELRAQSQTGERLRVEDEVAGLYSKIKDLEEAELRERKRAEETARELMALVQENKRLEAEDDSTGDELLQQRAAYDQLKEELRNALLQGAGATEGPDCELRLEVEELTRRLNDTQKELDDAQGRNSELDAQVQRLSSVAEGLQEHNNRTLEQLGSTTTQMHDLIQNNQTEAATMAHAHATELKQLKDSHATELKQLKDSHATELKQLKDASLNLQQKNQELVEQCQRASQELESTAQQRDALASARNQDQKTAVLMIEEKITEQHRAHSRQLTILAQEKEQARKVLSDCLKLVSEREEQVLILKSELGELHLKRSQEQESAQQNGAALEQERRERLLVERQLAEVSKSLEYVRQSSSNNSGTTSKVQNSEMQQLHAHIHELTLKNHELHQHATRKSQEAEILRASLEMLSQPPENQETNTPNSLINNPSAVAVASIEDITAQEQSGRSSTSRMLTRPELPPGLELEAENDAIKLRIGELVNELEQQIHRSVV